MNYKITNEKASGGINITSITDKKFKSNCITIRFISKLDEKTASANALIPNILISSNEKYRTRTELAKKMSELYGANLTTVSHKLGDNQVVGLSADCICDKYTLRKEKITQDVADILIDCIFRPLIENDGFANEEFSIRKQELIDTIDSEINDKRTYAILNAAKSIYKGEPSSIPSYGTKKGAEELTPKSAFKAFRALLETSQIEISLVGGEDMDKVKEKLINAFSAVERKPYDFKYITLSPIKDEVAEAVDVLDVNQCKMVMAFKSEYPDINVNKLMTMMLGGTAFSKLFMNVREKYSLCYYCSAGYIEGKGVLLVDSGVELKNVEKARKEIINQIDSLAKGDFTDDEMKNAVLSISGFFKTNYDTTRDMSAWFFMQKIRGTDYTPEKATEIYRKITREQIMESAKSFRLDTVYLMKPENKEADK